MSYKKTTKIGMSSKQTIKQICEIVYSVGQRNLTFCQEKVGKFQKPLAVAIMRMARPFREPPSNR